MSFKTKVGKKSASGFSQERFKNLPRLKIKTFGFVCYIILYSFIYIKQKKELLPMLNIVMKATKNFTVTFYGLELKQRI